MDVIRAERLGYAVRGRALVAEVDFGLAAGEFVALLGPNGAGKSTLLKLLSGDLAPAEGRIHFEGRALADWPLRELACRRAVLPQSSTVPFEFTAREIVLLGRSPQGDASLREEQAEEAMEKTACAHLRERTVTTLSGGEMQRVHLARVLLQVGWGAHREGSCLMLDEPISNLDPAHQHSALRVARELAQEGMAVMVVLHDLNLASQYANRILLMKGGRIRADGPPRAVLTEETISDIFEVRARIVENPFCDAPGIFVEPASKLALRGKS